MTKAKVTMNTKAKYTNSENYQKHFKLEDRIKIQKIIAENRDDDGNMTIKLKDIGDMLQNDPSTISKEVKKHRVFKERPFYQMFKPYNGICKKFEECKKLKTTACGDCKDYAKTSSHCIDHCVDYEEKVCPHLKKFPWVCNGCKKHSSCRLNKFYYYADKAQENYATTLVESREGINLTIEQFKLVDHVISVYVKAGQPIHHICATNDLPVTERTVYNYFKRNLFEAKNIDLRRKVKYKLRNKSSSKEYKKNKEDKIGRTYEDYLKFIKEHPAASVVQMDTVDSAHGSLKALLTLHFAKYEFQIAILLENKEHETIKKAFNELCDRIGLETFKELFAIILTDNGSEFVDPEDFEFYPETGEARCKIFYCHPLQSGEKGSCEKNHEYIRYVLPKQTVFSFLNQEKVNLMMSHINSTARPSIKATPYDFMQLAYGTDVLNKMQIKKIDSKDVSLLPSLVM